MNEPKTKKPTLAQQTDWVSMRNVRTFGLIAASVLGIYLCLRLAAPFLPALAFALALAVLFTPLQVWCEAKLKQPTLATILSTVAISIIVHHHGPGKTAQTNPRDRRLQMTPRPH